MFLVYLRGSSFNSIVFQLDSFIKSWPQTSKVTYMRDKKEHYTMHDCATACKSYLLQLCDKLPKTDMTI